MGERGGRRGNWGIGEREPRKGREGRGGEREPGKGREGRGREREPGKGREGRDGTGEGERGERRREGTGEGERGEERTEGRVERGGKGERRGKEGKSSKPRRKDSSTLAYLLITLPPIVPSHCTVSTSGLPPRLVSLRACVRWYDNYVKWQRVVSAITL